MRMMLGGGAAAPPTKRATRTQAVLAEQRGPATQPLRTKEHLQAAPPVRPLKIRKNFTAESKSWEETFQAYSYNKEKLQATQQDDGLRERLKELEQQLAVLQQKLAAANAEPVAQASQSEEHAEGITTQKPVGSAESNARSSQTREHTEEGKPQNLPPSLSTKVSSADDSTGDHGVSANGPPRTRSGARAVNGRQEGKAFGRAQGDKNRKVEQMIAQSRPAESSSQSQSTSPPSPAPQPSPASQPLQIPNASASATEEISSQSLLDELFPEASRQVHSAFQEKRPSPPKLDLPASGAPLIRPTLSDTRTEREKAIDAFRARGEQTTVLQLLNCSTALTEADFRRLIPRGLHIDTWSRDGEFYKIIPGRDPLSLDRLSFYYLLFRSPESALAYQKNAARLSKLSALHAPDSIHSPIMPPSGFLENGEDISAATSSFVLHPQGHKLELRTVMQPYNRALRALINAGGYTPIAPAIDPTTNKPVHRVLLHIDGYEPSHGDLWGIISRHAHARGIIWPFLGDHSSALRRLRDCINLKTLAKTRFQDVSSSNPRAPSSRDVAAATPATDHSYADPLISEFLGTSAEAGRDQERDAQESQEMNQLVMNRLYNRWIVDFEDEDAARRFAGLWHRVVLPSAKDKTGAWKETEEERWVEAEYLW